MEQRPSVGRSGGRRTSLFAYVEDDARFKPERFRRAGLREADVAEMKTSFDLLDTHGLGTLNLDEALDELESFKIERLEQEPLMIAIRACRRKSPTATFGDFVDALAPLLAVTEPTGDALRRAWRLMDEGRRGSICMEDLARVVSKFGMKFTMEEISDMIDFADETRDGEVKFDDFYSIFSRTQEHR